MKSNPWKMHSCIVLNCMCHSLDGLKEGRHSCIKLQPGLFCGRAVKFYSIILSRVRSHKNNTLGRIQRCESSLLDSLSRILHTLASFITFCNPLLVSDDILCMRSIHERVSE